ncbi:SNF2-related [Macleaya cordata]|uniref:SNF2-related n=1 Tax=Macleaya cordata TaxID=56857 RepID=A0A200QU00_MACCD|nr:SNF2-related [Macleaya cordata]
MTRGGILADAMGLGKIVMAIALILARPGRGIPDNQEIIKYDPEQVKRKYRNSQATYSSRVKGGTLIVCPMALLGQWKYGVDRTTTYALAEHGVVLTTYGVLDAAYKSMKHIPNPQGPKGLRQHLHYLLIACGVLRAPLFKIVWKISTVFCASYMLGHGVTGHVQYLIFRRLTSKPSSVNSQMLNVISMVPSSRDPSRGDSQKYADLNQLARQFLETNSNSDGGRQTVPTRAHVEEVFEGIRRGDNTECCLESADDPVLTPCAHKMCRECLLSSWMTSSGGPCPICRQQLRKNDLITCPSDNPFRVDIDNNWRESCKVAKLLDCLETLQKSGSGEKSIIFSQWTSFFDLLEIPLSRKGIGFLRFDGKLSQKNREKVLKEFNETNKKMVLLMPLKAGGVVSSITRIHGGTLQLRSKQ